jgi:hypothetical protein
MENSHIRRIRKIISEKTVRSGASYSRLVVLGSA